MVISEDMMQAVIDMDWVNGYLYFQSEKQAYADALWQEYIENGS